MPYSPKVTRVPPLAAPERPGWCCLRCLTRRGMSIGSALLSVVSRRGGSRGGLLRLADRRLDGGGLGLRRVARLRVRRVGGHRDRALRLATRAGASTGATRSATGGTRAGVAARLASSLRRGLALRREARDVALVDPDLHADAAEGRARLEEAVV